MLITQVRFIYLFTAADIRVEIIFQNKISEAFGFLLTK